MRTFIKTTLAALALGFSAAPVMAAPAYSTTDTDIGTLLDTAETKAILDKHLPGFSSDERVAMARGMTLRAVQPMVADQIKVEMLDAIDAELATLPAK